MGMKTVLAAGMFDDLKLRDFRFFEEAAKFGELNIIVWPDDIMQKHFGIQPKFPQSERVYFLQAISCIKNVFILNDGGLSNGMKKQIDKIKPDIFVVGEKNKNIEQNYLNINRMPDYPGRYSGSE